MKSINTEKLMGHSIGISDSYYRATENEFLDDFLKAVPLLTISIENRLQIDMKEVENQSRNNDASAKSQLYEKEQAIALLTGENSGINTDAIATLSDQITSLIKEIEMLKYDKSAQRR